MLRPDEVIVKMIEQTDRSFYAVREVNADAEAVKLLQVRRNALGYSLTRTAEQLLREIEQHVARLERDLADSKNIDTSVVVETIGSLREAYGIKKAFS